MKFFLPAFFAATAIATIMPVQHDNAIANKIGHENKIAFYLDSNHGMDMFQLLNQVETTKNHFERNGEIASIKIVTDGAGVQLLMEHAATVPWVKPIKEQGGNVSFSVSMDNFYDMNAVIAEPIASIDSTVKNDTAEHELSELEDAGYLVIKL